VTGFLRSGNITSDQQQHNLMQMVGMEANRPKSTTKFLTQKSLAQEELFSDLLTHKTTNGAGPAHINSMDTSAPNRSLKYQV
jgi:hypothetical protein